MTASIHNNQGALEVLSVGSNKASHYTQSDEKIKHSNDNHDCSKKKRKMCLRC